MKKNQNLFANFNDKFVVLNYILSEKHNSKMLANDFYPYVLLTKQSC